MKKFWKPVNIWQSYERNYRLSFLTHKVVWLVAIQLRCVGKWQLFYCKFFAESNGERIFKIDQYLAKLLTHAVARVTYCIIIIIIIAQFDTYDETFYRLRFSVAAWDYGRQRAAIVRSNSWRYSSDHQWSVSECVQCYRCSHRSIHFETGH